jgi:hypothetical protein
MATRKPKSIKERLEALGRRDGVKLGLVADQYCACVHIDPVMAKSCGFKPGDHIQIDHKERGTRIVRMLATCGCVGMRRGYIYLDAQSLHYLEGQVHDLVWLAPAEYPLDCP